MLGKLPRNPGDQVDEQEFADLGVLAAQLDGETAFAIQSTYRNEARKAFVKEDCSKRVARAIERQHRYWGTTQYETEYAS